MKKQGNHASGSATQETAILGGALVDASEVRADIATHKSPLKSSIRAVGVEQVKYNYAPSSFEASSYKHKGLTEEAMFAISSIATIATGGVMASSMSGVTLASNAVANAAMHGGIIAGASALASSAAVNLANNQGHLGRTIKATTSRKNLESIGKSALIGGITGGALEYTGLNGDLSKLSGRDLYGTIAKKVLVEELVSTGISGSDPSKIAERVGQRTILATAQHKVGDVGVAEKLPDGGVAKMALHGAVAGTFAQATGDKFVRGFAGGALGEFVGAKLYKGKGYKGYDPSRDIAGLSAGVTSMALGGSAKSMGRASQAATSAETYNRSLHSDETRIRQALSEEHSLEEMNAIDDRIMARIHGSDGVSDKASGKEVISGMQARGNTNPNAKRLDSIINKKAKELGIEGAFEYTWQDYMSDTISKREELWGRSKGGIRVGAGAALGVASSYAAVGSGGLSAGVSYLGMAAGADMMVSGSSEAFGTYHHKEGYRVLRSLTKPTLSYMQETSRDAAITAVEYGLAAGSTRIAGKVADAGGVVIAKASKKIASSKANEVSKIASTKTQAEFPKTSPVVVTGKRAIDKGNIYEQEIREQIYKDAPAWKRDYRTVVGGKEVQGEADRVFMVGKRKIAIEAKYTKSWEESLRNPYGKGGDKPWALSEQQNMLDQAKKYSSHFDETIYHTNSSELAKYYDKIFKDAGIDNISFVITPVLRK